MYSPKEEVDKRWREILDGEAMILKAMAPRGDRMH